MKVIATNNNQVQLIKHATYMSIVRDGRTYDPPLTHNVVFHVGKPDYIRRLWRNNFANAKANVSA